MVTTDEILATAATRHHEYDPSGDVMSFLAPDDGPRAANDHVQINSEADAAIGSDGSAIDSYIEREQNATHRTLGQDLDEITDHYSMSDLDSDFDFDTSEGIATTLKPQGTKRGWYNPKRYTQGKYTEFEGEFEIGGDSEFSDTESELSFQDSEPEQSRLEGQINDTRVVEPQAVDPNRWDMNERVPSDNPLDSSADFDSMDAEPYMPEAGPLQDVRGFRWSDPSTWVRKSNDLSEPLLQGTEMTDMSGIDRTTYELPLSHRPSAQELSPEFTPEMRAGLNDLIGKAKASGLSDTAIASEIGLGVSNNGGLWISRATLKEYMTKQAKGLMAAPLLVPLTMLLNTAAPGAGDVFSLGLVGADLLMTGDPLGAIIYTVGQAWDMAAQDRQAVIDDDTPDKDYGSKIGYVREGDTWYPAIMNHRFLSSGWRAVWDEGNRDMSMTLDYGHDIVWQVDGEGKFVPMIPNAKSKSFRATNDEYLQKTKVSSTDMVLGEEAFVKHGRELGTDVKKLGDVTRDWFFLSPEEEKRVMSGERVLESYTDDVTQMNSSARQINDWRKALDQGQDWKWSSAIATMGKGADINTHEGSRGLQRRMYEMGYYGDQGVLASSEQDYDQYVRNYAAQTGGDYDSGHGVHDSQLKKFLMEDVLKDHVEKLYQTQKLAAAEAGFDSLYNTKVGSALEANDPKSLRDREGGTVWSAMYLDTAKDMPVASTAEELQEQLHEIELLNDRSPMQRNYLAQKVQTRYWMQQVVGMGQSTELLHMLNGRDYNSGDPYGIKKYTTSATAQFDEYMRDAQEDPETAVHYWNLGDKIGYGVADQHLDEVEGFAMPWQNAGEGWLPTLTGSLSGTSAKDYMDDYRAANYDRLSESALKNTTQWVNLTGKVDPNLRIEGYDYNLQEGGLLHSLDEKVHTQTLAYDEFLRDNVPMGQNSKWTEFDPETGDYKLTEEGKAQQTQQEARDFVESEKVKPVVPGGVSASTQPEQEVETYADTSGADAVGWGSGMADDFGYTDQYQDYDLPEDWTWKPASGSDAQVWSGGIYTAPDGSRFGDSGRGPMGIDGDNWGGYYLDHDKVIVQARAELEKERADLEKQQQIQAQQDADLEAYRNMLSRKGAYGADRKRAQGEEFLRREADRHKRQQHDDRLRMNFYASQTGIRTKGDIERQKADFQRDDDIDAWHKRGIELGLIDEDFSTAPRASAANSHLPDHVVPSESVSVPMQHSVDHEEFNLPPMSSAFASALAAAERV